jgi:FAD/FMN-containing dehydrogenase/Fe-S oxidoreductase
VAEAALRRAAGVDAAALAADLRDAVRGEIRFDAGTRAVYSTDSSNYRQVPIGVVVPVDVEDVVRAVEVCRTHDAPVLPRGSGTSLAGQCCNVAVVLDCSKYVHRVLDIDVERGLARVQPGAILDDLRRAAESHGLTFGPDPSTHDHCTIGGMIGNNSCGVHSVMAEFTGPGPRMSDNVHELEVLTYDGHRLRVGRTSEAELEAIVRQGGRRGEIYAALRTLRDTHGEEIRARFPQMPRRVSGYDLDDLLPERGFDVAGALCGTEGTCVTVLEATVHLVPHPPARALVAVAFEDVYRAADAVPTVRAFEPIGLEGFDDVLVENNRTLGRNAKALERLPDGRGWLLAEFGGQTREEADDRAQGLLRKARRLKGFTGERLYDDPEEEHQIWEVRESGLGATAFVPGKDDAWEGWEDSAVPPEHLGAYLRDLRALFDRYGYASSVYGHFGQGCVHCRINFELTTSDGIAAYRRFVEDAADLVLGHGGSLSGEHGDGQSRAELLPKMYGQDVVRAFREFKGIWDPRGRMNPGKVVDPFPITSNLKLGADYAPREVRTHFSYPEDHGDFAHAALRCVGIGKCRRMDGGVMCPSFMVTREEEHTTRGRSRALFEMMRGDLPLWRSTEVKDALDLCLSCKGCKAECPVNVDMATYKAEFLSHHYRGRLRPRQAYTLGLIPWWSRLASLAPAVANAVSHAPVLSTALKRVAGVSTERDAPRFAPTTFRRWFRARGPRNRGSPPVILWPDTFVDHFQPEVGAAAVEVLESAGYRVALPTMALCCGRPLYDYGMLDLAERQLRRILDHLRPAIRAGVPVVGIEPSCLAVFRDELPNLFPDDPDAERLSSRSLLLSEFLVREVRGWEPPTLHRKALVQGHCHHRAVIGFDAEEEAFRRVGLDVDVLDAGCCGMAGSFGFEAGEKYEVGRRAGERVLLPRVREAEPETLVVADGFSCRTVIEQETDRRALHLAQVIRMAMEDGPGGPPGRPEDRVPIVNGHRSTADRWIVGGAALSAAALAAARLARRRRLSHTNGG